MFERNDRALLTARILILISVWLGVAASLAAGIALAVLAGGIYILISFAGCFVCWLYWVFARLYLSYLVDVKLIRNKLYGAGNYDLGAFLSAKTNRFPSKAKDAKADRLPSKAKDEKEVSEEELKYLGALLKNHIIDEEEFEKRKKQLTNKEK